MITTLIPFTVVYEVAQYRYKTVMIWANSPSEVRSIIWAAHGETVAIMSISWDSNDAR